MLIFRARGILHYYNSFNIALFIYKHEFVHHHGVKKHTF